MNLKSYGGYNGNLQCGAYVKQNFNDKVDLSKYK